MFIRRLLAKLDSHDKSIVKAQLKVIDKLIPQLKLEFSNDPRFIKPLQYINSIQSILQSSVSNKVNNSLLRILLADKNKPVDKLVKDLRKQLRLITLDDREQKKLKRELVRSLKEIAPIWPDIVESATLRNKKLDRLSSPSQVKTIDSAEVKNKVFYALVQAIPRKQGGHFRKDNLYIQYSNKPFAYKIEAKSLLNNYASLSIGTIKVAANSIKQMIRNLKAESKRLGDSEKDKEYSRVLKDVAEKMTWNMKHTPDPNLRD